MINYKIKRWKWESSTRKLLNYFWEPILKYYQNVLWSIRSLTRVTSLAKFLKRTIWRRNGFFLNKYRFLKIPPCSVEPNQILTKTKFKNIKFKNITFQKLFYTHRVDGKFHWRRYSYGMWPNEVYFSTESPLRSIHFSQSVL